MVHLAKTLFCFPQVKSGGNAKSTFQYSDLLFHGKYHNVLSEDKAMDELVYIKGEHIYMAEFKTLIEVDRTYYDKC